MLASITPLGERARGRSWAITATMFICAAIIGGAAVGTLLGYLGLLVMSDVELRWRLGLVVVGLAAGLAWETVAGRVPGPRRQVNERWLDDYRRWVYAVGFGAQLGAGITTIVVSSAVYAVCVAALASASPVAGAIIGAVAGGLRGAAVLPGAAIVTPERLVGFHSRMRSLDRPTRRVLLVGQLALLGAASLAMVV
jgi:MFS family permease